MPTVQVPESLGEAGEKLKDLAETATNGAEEAGKTATSLTEGLSTGNFFQNASLPELLNMGIAYGILLTGLISVIFMLIGGIRMIISHGDQEKVKQAVSTLRNSLVGLVIAVLAVLIVATVGKAFGMDIVKYLDFSKIIEIIQNIATGSQEAVDAVQETLP
jgi:hypothetical protein